MMVTESSTMSASAHSEDRKENSFLNRARPITSTSQPMVTSTAKYVMLVLVSGHFSSVSVNCVTEWPQNQLGPAAVLHDRAAESRAMSWLNPNNVPIMPFRTKFGPVPVRVPVPPVFAAYAIDR